MRRLYTVVSTAIVVGVLASSWAHAKQVILNPRDSADRVPGEIVVKLKDQGSSYRLQSEVLSSLRATLGESAVADIHPFLTDRSLNVVRLVKDADLERALAVLAQNPSVKYAEPNYLYHALDDGTPNDPDFPKTWGLNNTGQTDAAGQVGTPGADIHVVPAWQEGFRGSRNVVVAVIDTGVDWDHPDLAANIYTNPGESGSKADNGVDDDGNGFIDDVHGWNFSKNNNDSHDEHNHGSHCSGTIGGVGNNGKGVAGVNWEVSILPVKFLDATGSGTLENGVNAINYATKMKVQVMSNSWGSSRSSKAMEDAIRAAASAGIVFVAAAGNESSNNDTRSMYPASFAVPNVISVAATDNQDKLAKFSNYGAKSVHVAAPGVKIYSTAKQGKYMVMSGTSMATPHVAGISALLLSAHPEWNFEEIKSRLIRTSDLVPSLKGKTVSQGRVNVYRALHEDTPPPPPYLK